MAISMGARARPWSSTTRACALLLLLALVAAGAREARAEPGGAARVHGHGGFGFTHGGARRSLLQRGSCCTSDGSTAGTKCCPVHHAAVPP
ncbi:hypothetical protein SEVIR_9G115400v4 [Setaria viridis]|uniref:Uncharacterized protein n=1 Tax=Setaria viridis TaxID=4556 RepID=A0A4U6SSN6_SETVI|nr:hypothetical protein SEVIR_9G115400v2 [Setaria viridis]